MKTIIGQNQLSYRKHDGLKRKKRKDPSALKEREVPQYPSCLFLQYNTQLGPPYHILVDTNFNFSIKAKLDLVQSVMDCLYAKCIPFITDSLRIAKDPRFDLLPCTHKVLVQRVTQHKCYIVATKIPGVSILYISNHRYNIGWMPDNYGAP
uniref:rRNA-processing protein FCF1-like n=1 Tax=Cricetulus griseus TaxID=10029 RepID=A0A8C2LHB8_CRIGR